MLSCSMDYHYEVTDTFKAYRTCMRTQGIEWAYGWKAKPSPEGFGVALFMDGHWHSDVPFDKLKTMSKAIVHTAGGTRCRGGGLTFVPSTYPRHTPAPLLAEPVPDSPHTGRLF